MLDLEPSDADKKLVEDTFADEQLFKAVQYRFLPSLSKDVPIGQVQDIWLGIDQNIMGQSQPVIEQAIGLNEQSIEMVKQAVGALKGGDAPKGIHEWENGDLAIPLLARNRFIRAIETQLLSLKTVANQNEGPEDKSKNSSK